MAQCCLALLVLTSCSENSSEPAAVPTQVVISRTTLSLKVDRTEQLTATVKDQNGRSLETLPTGVQLRWSSSDSTRVTVDPVSGLARAVRPGTATVTATAGEADGSLLVTVVTSTPSTVQFTGSSLNLRMAETATVSARVLDDEGRIIDLTREATRIDWRSSDTTIVTVDGNGNARAVRPGQAALIARAASAEGTFPVFVLQPLVHLETNAEVKQRMGREGGVLTTTGAGGRRYILTVPAGALMDSVDVSLTPVAGIDNLPVGTQLIAAAHFGPEGRRLARPAVLRITGVTGNPVGFSYENTGAALQRTAAARKSDTVNVLVTHFSGAGAVMAADASMLPPPATPSSEGQYVAQLMALVEQGRQTGIYDAEAIALVLKLWYLGPVREYLGLFATDQLLNEALWVYGGWHVFVHCGANECGAGIDLWPASVGSTIRNLIATEIADARDRLRTALIMGIMRSNQKCTNDRDLQAAANVFYWQQQAEFYGLGNSPGLELVTVKAELCVNVVIVDATFPTDIQPNTPGQLLVKAGLSFDDGPPVYTPSLMVDVSATGTTDPDATGLTNNGTYTRSFTPTGSQDVTFDIRVSLVDRGLDAYGVLRDTVLQRPRNVSITITPVAALLDPGAQSTFHATVTGASNTNVTWTATGGQFTTNGNTLTYTAGSTPGTYSVTATTVSQPARSASARVDILGSTLVYENNFTGFAGSEWSSTAIATSPNGQRYLGDFKSSSVFRETVGVQLLLNELPSNHTEVTIEFDLYIIGPWDGNADSPSGPDIFTFMGGGTVLKRTTFANDDDEQQTFPGDHPGGSFSFGTGSIAQNTLGFSGGSSGNHGDTTYRLRYTFAHTGPSVAFSWVAGIQSEERFGIDNVRVLTR